MFGKCFEVVLGRILFIPEVTKGWEIVALKWGYGQEVHSCVAMFAHRDVRKLKIHKSCPHGDSLSNVRFCIR